MDPYANQDAGLSIGLPECGNGILEIGEACDGLDLGETSCASFLMDGDLACDEHCDLDLSGCISTTGGGALKTAEPAYWTAASPKFLHLWRWNHRTARILRWRSHTARRHLRHLRAWRHRDRNLQTGLLTRLFKLRITAAAMPAANGPRHQSFFGRNGAVRFFGSSGSSCVACHQYVTTATNVYTWDTDNPDVMRSSLLTTVSGYPTISHYNDGPNYGRVLGETDIPELSILAYKSKLGVFPPTDSEHNNHHLNSSTPTEPQAELGESLLTFIDFFIHPNDHQICE